jgi:hypothetical protein
MEKISLVKEIRELKTQLAYSRKIGFFFGAGTSCTLNLPNIAKLTEPLSRLSGQSLTHAPVLDIRLYPANQATVRDLVLRLKMAENDTNTIPSINNTAPNMRNCGGAGSQGVLNRNPFGLPDNMANRWSVVKRTLMATASKPTMIMSHPANRTPLRRNCNLSRRSNRRAASTFGDFIGVPCKTSVALERPLALDNTKDHWRIGSCVSVRPGPVGEEIEREALKRSSPG